MSNLGSPSTRVPSRPCRAKAVLPVHLHDDRLADWPDRLDARDAFGLLERDPNQQTTRVYQLLMDTVRIDTTAAGPRADVLTEQGPLQFGHSNDDPDRPQLKVAAGMLDPPGMPLVTVAVPGSTADDPSYVPALQAARQSLAREVRSGGSFPGPLPGEPSSPEGCASGGSSISEPSMCRVRLSDWSVDWR